MASFHDLKTVLTTEPAIEFIKKQMESILSVVDFEYQGEVLNVDGFRLKNLDNWRHEIIEDPSSELIRYIGRMKPCGSRCEFCFLRGNPREVIFNTSYYVTEKEFDTRFRYYFDDREGMLFFQRFNFEEVLNAPLCLSLLKKMREYTDEPFILITGGQLIDDARLEELRLLMPLKLHISINSCRPESRRKIMGHRHTDRLHRILPLVARKGIPFLTSLVAWPSLSLDDILDTIQFCDSCETLYTEVYLPGYTNLNVPGKDFNWQTYYNDICDNIERLRGSVKSGIVVIPSIYDARRRGVTWNECRLTGIVNGSPGHKAGLMPGDMVTGAGSVAFSSRPQAIRILNWAQEKAIPVDLKVRRGINAFTATLSPWLIKESASLPIPSA